MDIKIREIRFLFLFLHELLELEILILYKIYINLVNIF